MVGLGGRLGLDRLLQVGGGGGLLRVVAANGRSKLLDLGGGLLGGLDPLCLLGTDAVDRGGQLAELGQVVGGDGAAARLRVEGPDGAVEEAIQLFVGEGGDVLGKGELFHGAGLQMIVLGGTRPKTSGRQGE